MASPSDNPLKRFIREIPRRSLGHVLGAGVGVAILFFGCGGRDTPGPQGYDFVPAVAHVQTGSPLITITTLSARSDMVSGGDVLIRAELSQGIEPRTVRIERNGTDVTDAFRAEGGGGGGLGLGDGRDLG